MSFQPKEEKDAERQLITNFATKIGAKVIKLQEDNDDGKTDGVIEYDGKEINVEARRKGYPNHSGKAFFFKDGWKNKLLVNGGGIFLNELTIKHHQDKGFVYIVEIRGAKPKAAVINAAKVTELLKQPRRTMKSTNTGVMQSVKTVPLDWFTKEL